MTTVSANFGDGVTDATAHIQDCINQAMGNGRILDIPAGVYLIGKPLRLPGSITVRGGGEVTRLKRAKDAEGDALLKNASTTSGITIESLMLDGSKSDGAARASLIKFVGVSDSRIANVHLTEARTWDETTWSAWIEGGSRVVFENNTISGGREGGIRVQARTPGVLADGDAVGHVIRGNSIHGCGGTAISVLGAQSTMVQGNRTYGNNLIGTYTAVSMNWGRFNTVSDNHVVGGLSGINIGHAGKPDLDCLVTGNTVDAPTQNGVYIYSPRVRVVNNHLSRCPTAGIGTNTMQNEDPTITGNVVTDCGGVGVNVSNTDGAIVTGNRIDGATKFGIAVYRSSLFTVIGNDVRNTRQLDGIAEGIRVSGTADLLSQLGVVASNTCRDTQEIPTQLYGVRLASTSRGVRVGDNLSMGNILEDLLDAGVENSVGGNYARTTWT